LLTIFVVYSVIYFPYNQFRSHVNHYRRCDSIMVAVNKQTQFNISLISVWL